MMRLKSKLLSLNPSKAVPTKIFSPANCEELRIPFRQDKVARVVGRLANQIQIPKALPSPPSSADEDDESRMDKKAKTQSVEGQLVTGVLVQNDFKLSLMAPEDLKEYAGLTTTTIMCRQRLTLSYAGVDLIRWALEGTFGAIRTVSSPSITNGNSNGAKTEEEADEEIKRPEQTVFEVMGAVTVKVGEQGEVEVEWEGNMANDGIADAVLAVLFTVESSPAAVKQSSKQHSHSHEEPKRNPHAGITPQERLSRLCMFLEAQFGEDAIKPIEKPKLPIVTEENGEAEDSAAAEKAQAQRELAELQRLHEAGIPVPGLEIRLDEKLSAKVWLETLEVECNTKSLRERIKAVVDRACEVIAPLWE